MSMSGPGGGDEDETGAFVDINITPLTDVILVLLIIFMVTSTAVVEQERAKAQGENEAGTAGLQVELPGGARSTPVDEAPDVFVKIGADGQFELAGAATAAGEVRARLSALHEAGPDSQLVIEADTRSAHGRVVWLMETAKAVGFKRLAIATAPLETLPPEP